MNIAGSKKLLREELGIKFVNTVAWRLRDPVEERAPSPRTMLDWMLQNGLLDRSQLQQIDLRWRRLPREGQTFLDTAVELREAAYSLFLAQIKGARANPAATKILNMNLAGSITGVRLISERTGFEWRASSGATAPAALLKPIAWSVAALLTGPRTQRIKQCQDERGCGWLFIDESRAQNRRWCSMGNCGNLAKSRRHYRRMTDE